MEDKLDFIKKWASDHGLIYAYLGLNTCRVYYSNKLSSICITTIRSACIVQYSYNNLLIPSAELSTRGNCFPNNLFDHIISVLSSTP